MGDGIRYESYEGWPEGEAGRRIAELQDRILGGEGGRSLAGRLGRERGVIVLTASEGERLVGYKIGFARETHWYSWSGGVDPSWRRRGIARELMDRQHRLVAAAGWDRIRTKTRNRFKAMLVLDLLCGFEIVGLEADGRGDLKIHLEKRGLQAELPSEGGNA